MFYILYIFTGKIFLKVWHIRAMHVIIERYISNFGGFFYLHAFSRLLLMSKFLYIFKWGGGEGERTELNSPTIIMFTILPAIFAISVEDLPIYRALAKLVGFSILPHTDLC